MTTRAEVKESKDRQEQERIAQEKALALEPFDIAAIRERAERILRPTPSMYKER